MTDQEINEAVARKLGWKSTRTKYSTFDGQHDAEVIRTRVSRMPDYCHSIAAAWEIVPVVETMKSDKCCHWVFELHYGPENDWYCVFHNNTDVTDSFRKEVHAKASAAPMAICKAFLKLP